MRKAGWLIENDKGANKAHTVRWKITAPPPEMGGIAALPPSPTSPLPLTASGTSLAIHACGQSQDAEEQVEPLNPNFSGMPSSALLPDDLLAMFNGEDL
jgi:hypothetical protein